MISSHKSGDPTSIRVSESLFGTVGACTSAEMFEGTKATGPLFFVVFVKGIGGVLSNGKIRNSKKLLTLEGWKGKTTFGVLDLPSKKPMITMDL